MKNKTTYDEIIKILKEAQEKLNKIQEKLIKETKTLTKKK